MLETAEAECDAKFNFGGIVVVLLCMLFSGRGGAAKG
jgi:hypothetical protein